MKQELVFRGTFLLIFFRSGKMIHVFFSIFLKKEKSIRKNYKIESKWSKRPAASCNVDSFLAKQKRSTWFSTGVL